jgi:hypothetical protein
MLSKLLESFVGSLIEKLWIGYVVLLLALIVIGAVSHIL